MIAVNAKRTIMEFHVTFLAQGTTKRRKLFVLGVVFATLTLEQDYVNVMSKGGLVENLVAKIATVHITDPSVSLLVWDMILPRAFLAVGTATARMAQRGTGDAFAISGGVEKIAPFSAPISAQTMEIVSTEQQEAQNANAKKIGRHQIVTPARLT